MNHVQKNGHNRMYNKIIVETETISCKIILVNIFTKTNKRERRYTDMKRRSYCTIDDTTHTITFVASKLTKKEQEQVKGLIAIGYIPNRKNAEDFYPERFSKKNVENFLKTKGEQAEKAFNEEKESECIDKETGAPKLYKNGKARKKGYVGALKKFREKYEDEFLKWLEENKEKEENKEDKEIDNKKDSKEDKKENTK